MLTKFKTWLTGKPANYAEMWAKLAAVLGSVKTAEQYDAAKTYTWLWYDTMAEGMSFGRSLDLCSDLRSMLREVRLRVEE